MIELSIKIVCVIHNLCGYLTFRTPCMYGNGQDRKVTAETWAPFFFTNNGWGQQRMRETHWLRVVFVVSCIRVDVCTLDQQNIERRRESLNIGGLIAWDSHKSRHMWSIFSLTTTTWSDLKTRRYCPLRCTVIRRWTGKRSRCTSTVITSTGRTRT